MVALSVFRPCRWRGTVGMRCPAEPLRRRLQEPCPPHGPRAPRRGCLAGWRRLVGGCHRESADFNWSALKIPRSDVKGFDQMGDFGSMKLTLLCTGARCFLPPIDGTGLATKAGGAFRFDHAPPPPAYRLAALRLLCCVRRSFGPQALTAARAFDRRVLACLRFRG